MARMQRPAAIVDVALRARELTSLYGRMELVVGVRMHAGILAMTAGTPFVGIAYGIKHAGIMEDLGLARYLMDIDTLEADRLVAAVTSALDDGPRLRALLAERVPDLQARVRSGSERLAATIRDAADHARAPSKD
jgi:polysaccharide pyruvyl transferase WcaK-like protein